MGEKGTGNTREKMRGEKGGEKEESEERKKERQLEGQDEERRARERDQEKRHVREGVWVARGEGSSNAVEGACACVWA